MALPVPGVDEVNLVAKVGTSVVRGLSQPSQPAPWPNTRDALLELLVILDEWHGRARETTEYAGHLALIRSDPSAPRMTIKESRWYANANVADPMFLGAVQADIRHALLGQIPPLARLRRSKKRRAARRGLRTILVAYCPDPLEQFDEATAARLDWVKKHDKEFERWFDESHTDEEVAQLLAAMESTEQRLFVLVLNLTKFITLNFPLTNYAQGQ
jgi:hypothetical protein